MNKEQFPDIDAYDEDRADVIASNGNTAEHYQNDDFMCGDRFIETGSPWSDKSE